MCFNSGQFEISWPSSLVQNIGTKEKDFTKIRDNFTAKTQELLGALTSNAFGDSGGIHMQLSHQNGERIYHTQ